MENLPFTLPQKRAAGLAGLALIATLMPSNPAGAEEARSFSMSAYGAAQAEAGAPTEGREIFDGIDLVTEHEPARQGTSATMLFGLFDLPGRFGFVLDNASGRPQFGGIAIQPTDNVRIILDSAVDERGRSVSGALRLRVDF